MTTALDSDGGAFYPFPDEARRAFSTLAAEYGLDEVGGDWHTLQYRGALGSLGIYFGRSSRELSLGFSLAGAPETEQRPFDVGDFMRVCDPERELKYRYFAVSSRGGLRRGLEQLAADLRRYAPPPKLNDPAFVARVTSGREAAGRAWLEGHGLRNDLENAETAFRGKDWRRAVELYEKRDAHLSKVERKRLEIARKRLSGG